MNRVFILIICLIVTISIFLDSPNYIAKENAQASNYEKIVSLAPNFCETIKALNEEIRLVGVTDQCRAKGIGHAKIIGSFQNPSFEAIINLKPDLVLAVPHVLAKSTITLLKKYNIEVFSHQPDKIKDIKFIISELSKKLNITQKGNALIKNIDTSIKDAENLIAQKGLKSKKKSMLIAIAHNPLVVAGPNSFVSEIISVMGFKNLASKSVAWPLLPLEEFLTNPPDFLFVLLGKKHIKSYENLISTLGIDQNKINIKIIAPEEAVLLSPSPRIAEELKILTNLVINKA